MRTVFCTFVFGMAASFAAADVDTILLPEGNFGQYDPTLSAREAVLANWELAASGLRAGHILSAKVVAAADDELSFDALKAQAAFAQKTILARYNAAAWAYVASPELPALSEASMREMVESTQVTDCASADCASEISALRSAFDDVADDLRAAFVGTRALIDERQGQVDRQIMSEQLSLMAELLDDGSWGEELTLSDHGMDVAMVSDRIVGTMSLWTNIEPYVGITDQSIDDAINVASQNLLRTLRRETRGVATLDADAQVTRSLNEAATALAQHLRQASELFAS